MEEEKEKVWDLEERVIHLELEHHQLCQEVVLVKAASSECVLQMAELMAEVQPIWLMNTVCQHSPMSLIVVKDNEGAEEGEVFEEKRVLTLMGIKLCFQMLGGFLLFLEYWF